LRFIAVNIELCKEEMKAIGTAAAGVGLIAIGLANMRAPKGASKSATLPSYLKPLTSIVGDDAVAVIAMDPQWSELADRASEFYVIAKEEFKDLLLAIASVVAFQVSLQVNSKKINFGTPRLFRTKLHAVVEAVRDMRYTVEQCCPSALDDFDEIAADIQRSHDDAAYNMQLESAS